MPDFLLSIDIGTSACKVAVFNADGEAVSQESVSYEVHYPKAGWAQQDPDCWWEAVCRAIKSIKEKGIPFEEIRGIGVDGQSWSAIPVDEQGRVLSETPIWFDTRAREICDEIQNGVSGEEIFALCGNSLQASYSLPKIRWFERYMPDVYKRTYRFLQSNSFIVYRLTGALTQDRSQGYGYQCYDMRNGKWDIPMCERLGIDPEKLPDLADSHEVVGAVSRKASEQTGLTEGIPVVAGGLDAACGALGAGVLHDGETQEQGGQAGGMSICIESYHADPRLILSGHVVPGRWLLQGGTVGGGGVMRWLSEEFGESSAAKARQNGTSLLDEMNKEAQAVPAGSQGMVFLPYMAGERSPIWNPKAKGVFYGLDFSKSRAHMIRSAMEGVAFSLLHNLETAREAGVNARILRSMGGAANSRLWTQIKADVTGCEILVPSSDTATGLGAAILAGVGTGIYGSFEEAVERTVSIRRSHTPDMEKNKQYRKNYEVYLKLYEALEPVMNQWEED